MKEEENKMTFGQAMIVIFILIVVGGISFSFFKNSQTEEESRLSINEMIMCYGEDGYLIAAKEEEEDRLMREAASKVGCMSANYWFCRNSKDQGFVYDSDAVEFIETNESKECAHFRDTRKTDIPVKCLSYFELN